MKILLISPQYPDTTFWGFKRSLKIVLRGAVHPPLGLLTVASMLPSDWEKRLIDMNITRLTDKDLEWADYVFISAMVVQRESVMEIIKRCKELNTRMVAGGPLFTSESEKFGEVNHLVLNEAEITLPSFLEDLKKGCAKHIYTSEERPDVDTTPIPAWYLLNTQKYVSMSVQYSRGCPFDCEFCDIVVLFGHKIRTKSRDRFLAELEALYNRGWRAAVFVVDDNFIGNKKQLKEEILPAIIDWQKEKKYPFTLSTQVSINFADDEELMRLMSEAGFDRVFIGIESPNEESLIECGKRQNKGRDLIAEIHKIQQHGFDVQGGFILGFDKDPDSVFQDQIDFIEKSGIVMAMVGLLNAPRGTKLHKRLGEEKRLVLDEDFSGDNTDRTINFIPAMDKEKLFDGYRKVLNTIYSSKKYYARIKTFLKQYNPRRQKKLSRLQWWNIRAFVRSMWFLGVMDKERMYYWKFFFSTLLKRPRSFSISVALTIQGLHFRKFAERIDKLGRLRKK